MNKEEIKYEMSNIFFLNGTNGKNGQEASSLGSCLFGVCSQSLFWVNDLKQWIMNWCSCPHT